MNGAMAELISPARASQLAALHREEQQTLRLRAGLRALDAFERDRACHYRTPRGCPDTNVQSIQRTWNLPPEFQHELLGLLEACRREGSVCHFAERQGNARQRCAGLMLDFDVLGRRQELLQLSELQAQRVGAAVALQLAADLELPGPAAWLMAFTVKPAPLRREGTPYWKYGFHLLVPGLQLERCYKRLLIARLRGSAVLRRVLEELGSEEPEGCLDPNSAHVPVFYVGSAKPGGAAPYELRYAFEAGLEPGLPPMLVGALPRLLDPAVNVVAELGLLLEARYEGGRAPLVRKREWAPRPEVLREAAAGAAPAGEEGAGQQERQEELEALLATDHEVRYVHALLSMLPPPYYEEYGRWRDVVFALSSEGERFRPLADWFSRQSARFEEGALQQLWTAGTTTGGGGRARLTVKSVAHWARMHDPARFEEVNRDNARQALLGEVYKNGGRIAHMTVVPLLYRLFGHKYVADQLPTLGRLHQTVWWEFVTPQDPQRPGEVWKWRREPHPDGLWNQIPTTIAGVAEQVSVHLRDQIKASAEEERLRHFKGLLKVFEAQRMRLMDTGFINACMQAAERSFRRRGMYQDMDALPDLLGVANGVLRLGRRAELLTGFHHLPVSKYTPVPWAPFDCRAPWTRLALGCAADIVAEPDARDWLLFHAAQGLFSGPKEGFMLLWEGGGSNGKTAFLRAVTECLGPYADKFNVQLLCGRREEADRPNSAAMVFKRCNYLYCEETDQGQVMSVARMKELVNVGKMSARELNTPQDSFKVRSNVVVASQYNLTVPTGDHGTWRRLRAYRAKRTFKTRPHGPFERAKDPRFLGEYLDEPEYLAAWLSILVHYYERLQREYGGLLERVPCPTLDRETERFRMQQDVLHKWVCQCFVRSPQTQQTYDLAALAELHIAWYNRNVDNRKVRSPRDIMAELENCALGGHLQTSPNGVRFLSGFRVLEAADLAGGAGGAAGPGPGESWLALPGGGAEPDGGGAAAPGGGGEREAWWDDRKSVV